ncbi:MAG: hypothetical protein MI810_11975 [Flavobacteriales bacterium]|jgi:hypothetical protein|nr:hypothetical protein [Flavobacteriales bacterium]
MGEIIIFVGFFSVIFSIAYLFFTTRNKERLALIEKGVDAGIFLKGRSGNLPIWKIIVLNVSLLLMGIGMGIFIGSVLHFGLGVDDDIAFPGTIFFMAGLSLFLGLMLSKKFMENKE